jgi:hypothetical protein
MYRRNSWELMERVALLVIQRSRGAVLKSVRITRGVNCGLFPPPPHHGDASIYGYRRCDQDEHPKNNQPSLKSREHVSSAIGRFCVTAL